MAQLKSSVVQGSLRVTDTTYTNDLNISSVTASKIAKIDANKNLTSDDLTASEIPNLSTDKLTSGTLGVARGGTGAASFTANSLIMSGSTTTAALTTRSITDNSSASAISTGTSIPTERDIYYGLPTINNSHAYTSSTTIYAPTGAGTANQILVSAGGTSAPTWKATANGAAYATSANGALTFGTLPIAQGGTGITTTDPHKVLIGPSSGTTAAAPTWRTIVAADLPTATTSALGIMQVSTGLSVSSGAVSVAYGTAASTALQGNQNLFKLNNSNKTAASAASFYAPTAGGTAGYILIGAGTTSAPIWNGALTLSGTAASTWTATFKGQIIGTSDYSYGDTLPTGTQTTGRIFFQTATTEYELPSGGSSGQLLVKTGSSQTAVAWSNTVSSLTVNGTVNAYQVYNAVWNDYAECRQSSEIEPGRVITETYNGNMELATQRLMPACKVISDTYGSLMGKSETAQTPIAVAGRVLVYPYKEREAYHLGDAVCSAPDGTVDIMSREEIRDYPERIIGTVSEIPNYEIWYAGGKEQPIEISVNGRIWIYVR